MKFQQATEKQRLFIKKYVSSGDELESARVAGYSDRSLPSLRAEASRLKRRLASQIADELRLNRKQFFKTDNGRGLGVWSTLVMEEGTFWCVGKGCS